MVGDSMGKEYVPTVLRKDFPNLPPREVRYAIGELKGENSVGFWFGPVLREEECLEQLGQSEDSVILRFNPDWTEDPIWVWHQDRWLEVPPLVKKS